MFKGPHDYKQGPGDQQIDHSYMFVPQANHTHVFLTKAAGLVLPQIRAVALTCWSECQLVTWTINSSGCFSPLSNYRFSMQL